MFRIAQWAKYDYQPAHQNLIITWHCCTPSSLHTSSFQLFLRFCCSPPILFSPHQPTHPPLPPRSCFAETQPKFRQRNILARVLPRAPRPSVHVCIHSANCTTRFVSPPARQPFNCFIVCLPRIGRVESPGLRRLFEKKKAVLVHSARRRAVPSCFTAVAWESALEAHYGVCDGPSRWREVATRAADRCGFFWGYLSRDKYPHERGGGGEARIDQDQTPPTTLREQDLSLPQHITEWSTGCWYSKGPLVWT